MITKKRLFLLLPFCLLLMTGSCFAAQPKEKKECVSCGLNSRKHCNCKEANYCSRNCQKADWKEHRKNCSERLREVGAINKYGRIEFTMMKASEVTKAGHILGFQDNPFPN